MSKAGYMLLAAITLVVIAILLRVTGTHAQTSDKNIKAIPQSSTLASLNVSTCSAILVSQQHICNRNSNVCDPSNVPFEREVKKQIQAAVTKSFDLRKKENIVLPAKEESQIIENGVATPGATLNADLIFDMTNEYRASLNLPPFEKEEKVCNLAEERTSELYKELYVTGGLHSGLYNRNLPYWIFENAKVGSDERGTLNWWISSPVHRSSIVDNYKYSCVKCRGNMCSQLFTSYEAKTL